MKTRLFATPTIVVAIFLSTANVFGASPGDIDGQNGVTLKDAVLSLQICAGLAASGDIAADVDGNGQIGLAEALFALRTAPKGAGSLLAFGDTGKPADYDENISDLSQFIDNLEAYEDELEPRFDWRDQGAVTPVKNQGGCGSCWAFASVAALESKILIERQETHDLSEQQLVSCNLEMQGCDGGDANALRHWTVAGPVAESCAKYAGRETPCSEYNSCSTLPFYVAKIYNVETRNRRKMQSSLKKHGPAYFRFDVYSDFSPFWSAYSPGAVYRNAGGYYMGVGHAVLLIGWDDNKGAWLCKNSYGANNGPNGNGTFWIAYAEKGHANPLHFGMTNFQLNPDFMVTSPNGGENWEIGKSYTIRWNKGKAETVRIQLYKGLEWIKTITENTGNNGLYEWTAPESLSSADDYRIRITDVAAPSRDDYSDAAFSIAGPLRVASPNGGELWYVRNTYTIEWQTGTDNGDVGIYLYNKGEDTLRRLAEKTANSGQWSWTIPDTVPAGDDYKISVQLSTDDSVLDQSDDFFQIAYSPLPSPTNLKASNGASVDRVALSWDPISGAEYYKVFRNTSIDPNGASEITSWQSGTVYEDAAITLGQTYYYWVKAAETFSGDGESGFSDSDSGYAMECTYGISPASDSFSSDGGSGTVTVTAPAGCRWSASSNVDWVTIDSGNSGSGNGTVSYSVSENTETVARTGGISIGGKLFEINQDKKGIASIPKVFDWRDQGVVTPAGDQGPCGSVWAFVAVGAMESKITIMGGQQYNLSEQQLISCDDSMFGCAGGSASALKYFIEHGPMKESCTGYGSSPDDVTCEDINHCEELPYRAENYYTVNASSIKEVKESVYNDGPAYFRFDVYSDFLSFWSDGASGNFYTQVLEQNLEGGHVGLLIGWDDYKNAWLCKNSWGATSGPNSDGTFWIAYEGHLNDLNFGCANFQIKTIK